MGDIAEAYQEMFDTSLEKGIKSETSGDYRRMLLKMLGVEDKSSGKDKDDNHKRGSSRDRDRDRDDRRDNNRDRSRDRYSRDSRDRSPSPEDHRRRRR